MVKYKGLAWRCELCDKAIAKPTTNKGSAKGLLMMHLKAKHDYKLFPPTIEPVLRRERDLEV